MRCVYLVFLILSWGCSESNFRKVENLDRFRIIAIHADNPEVAPGGSAILQLFVSDPNGGGRVISGNTVACIDPGISLGALVSCDHDPNRVSGMYTIDTTVADLSNNLYTGRSGSMNVTVPNSILLGRSDRDKNNGVGYIVIFTFTIDGNLVRAFKRIMATNRVTLNSNPTGSTILLNGVTFSGTPQKGDHLNLTTSSPENYAYLNVDGSTENRIEDMQVAWYVSEGAFDKPKTNIGEEIELIKDPPSGPYLILGVVRDGRGGVEVVRTKVF